MECCNKFISIMFHLDKQIKLWHWQTGNHAEHVSLGSLYDVATELTDRFVEVYCGINDVCPSAASIPSMTLVDYNSKNPDKAYESMRMFLLQIKNKLHTEVRPDVADETDLCNILDEIYAEIHKACNLIKLT